jgi:general secretion pathway protein E
MLRQDPNVMMVGEIRDAETAGIAIQAGLSGHLILTTIHAESSAGVFARLIEIGVEPFVLASASLASVSQRLVRVLCPHCRRVGPPTQAQQDRLGALGAKANFSFDPVGCVRCGNRGYLGRTAIYELLEVTPAVRELINQRVPTAEIVKAARGSMETMLADGVAKADVGVTSLDEVFRVVG